MGSGGRGWAVVVGDLEHRWMWTRMDVEVARLMTQHVQVCLDLEIFVRVYAATIHY